MEAVASFRVLVHQPSARERAGAERAAAALLADVENAATDSELCGALNALQEACSAKLGEHVATALVRLDAVPRLCALLAQDVDAGSSPSNLRAVAEALYSLRALVEAASDNQCACCKGGPTRAGAEAVEQLARCGGVSQLAALLQSHSHLLASTAARCTQAIFGAVFYAPALEEVMTSECLENVLYLAGGEPRPFSPSDSSVPDRAQLALLYGMVNASAGAALRLAQLPATPPVLLRLLEPDEAVKRLELMDAYRPPQDIGAGLRAVQNDAARVLGRVLCAMQAKGDELPSMYVQPLVLSLLHIVLTKATDISGALDCIQYLCFEATLEPQLPKLAPVAMLRALCAQADSADGACARLTVLAFAACSATNAALLKALLAPTSQHLLIDDLDQLPAALSAAEVEQLKKTQLDTLRRAFRARDDASEDHATAIGTAASAKLKSAASAATTARARLALQRAASYVQLCAMAPHVGIESFLGYRSNVIRNGYSYNLSFGYVAAEAVALGWPDVTCVYSTSGMLRLTMGEAPELFLLLDVPGIRPPDAGQIDPIGSLLRQAGCVVLYRVARYGWDMMDEIVPALPVFDSSGAFVLSAEELALNDDLSPELKSLKWRFEQTDLSSRRAGAAGSSRWNGAAFVCSLASTFRTAPPHIASQLHELLAVRSDSAFGGIDDAHDDCSTCPTCIARRATGRLCALPSCTSKHFVDGTALKLCKRCTRVAYCCREVRSQQQRTCMLFSPSPPCCSTKSQTGSATRRNAAHRRSSSRDPLPARTLSRHGLLAHASS